MHTHFVSFQSAEKSGDIGKLTLKYITDVTNVEIMVYFFHIFYTSLCIYVYILYIIPIYEYKYADI